ncbi:hypothetical protein E4U28_001520, partial [Claviceps purpurea]
MAVNNVTVTDKSTDLLAIIEPSIIIHAGLSPRRPAGVLTAQIRGGFLSDYRTWVPNTLG